MGQAEYPYYIHIRMYVVGGIRWGITNQAGLRQFGL